jgi:uncharacterized protein YfaQ (DUF2300 family)
MEPNILKKSSPRYTAAVILFIFSYLSSPAVYSQDFSSIDQDLAQLWAMQAPAGCGWINLQALAPDKTHKMNN